MNIQPLIDFDYINKLNEEEKAWLSKFVVEYYSADFRGDKPIIKGKKAKREIYRTNNSRNADLFSLLSTHGMTNVIKDWDSVSKNFEDNIIELLDVTKKFSK